MSVPGDVKCLASVEKSSGYTELKKEACDHYAIPLDTLKGASAQCVAVAGSTHVESSGRVKVNSSKDVLRVRGRFRAIGTKPSAVYFGIREFTNVAGFDECVSSEQTHRTGNACQIVSYSEKDLTLTLLQAPAGWVEPVDTGNYHQCRLGFYIDGEIDHPKTQPVLVAPSSAPAYRSITGNVIKLWTALQPAVAKALVANVTKVMNHRSGGASWNYGGINGELLDPKTGWIHREFTVRPAGTSMFLAPHDANPYLQYRPFTNSVTLLVLANWGQTNKEEAELLISDLSISVSSPAS
jgi:hypothetical protein